jgi:signal transduction histidine kinase
MTGSEPLHHHDDPWLASFEVAGALERALARSGTSAREVSSLVARLVLSSLDAIGVLLTPEGNVVGATAAYLRAAGLEQAEVQDRTVWALPVWHAPTDAAAVQDAVTRAAQGRSATAQVRFSSDVGAATRPLSLLARPVRDSDGRVVFVLVQQQPRADGRVAPVSDDAALAQQLRRLMDMRQRLVADIGHDVRTPLMSITARGDRLLDHPDEEVRAHAREMRAAALAALSQVEELGDLASVEHRRTQLRTSRTDLARTVRSIVRRFEPIATSRRIALEVDVPVELFAHLDDDKVTRIVSNLLANAMRYTPLGGRVSVRARADDEHATIEIADSGPGIPPAEREAVFRRTYRGTGAQRSTAGSGLGLAIVREAVDLHRGTIEVSDADEGGTRMTVVLPCVTNGDSTPAVRSLREEASRQLTTELAVADLEARLDRGEPSA